MRDSVSSRRNFVKAAAGAAWVAALGGRSSSSAFSQSTPAGPTGGPAQAIRLGGPVFRPSRDPEELALAHRKLGYRAAYCPGVTLGDTDRIRDIARAFAKHDVLLAEVGRWCNLLDADSVKRAANLKTVTDGLALAEAVGALCCVDIAGSYNPKSWHGPDAKNLTKEFFDASVENARKIVDAVKPKRAKFCFEMMGWAMPDSPDCYVAMIKAVDRPGFGVHLDPCNLINSPNRYYGNTALLNECFDKLGPWIVSCHAKDMGWESDGSLHLREVLPGTGVLDYATYLKRLATLPSGAPLMLEHLKTAEEYAKAQRYVLDTGAKAGVRFE